MNNLDNMIHITCITHLRLMYYVHKLIYWWIKKQGTVCATFTGCVEE